MTGEVEEMARDMALLLHAVKMRALERYDMSLYLGLLDVTMEEYTEEFGRRLMELAEAMKSLEMRRDELEQMSKVRGYGECMVILDLFREFEPMQVDELFEWFDEVKDQIEL